MNVPTLNKSKYLTVRISPEDLNEVKRMAIESSKSLTDYVLNRLLPVTPGIYENQQPSCIVHTLEIKVPKKRCMAPYCKSLETTSKLVHGATVWLCSEHHDKG